MPTDLYAGDNFRKGGNRVYLPESSRHGHMHVIGRTGTGKTSFLEHCIRQDILNGNGLCLIDVAGNLYDRLVRFLAYLDLSHPIADRVVLIDPSDTEYSVAINYLEQVGDIDAGVILQTVMEGLARLYKEQDQVKPRWETYAPLTIIPLIRAGLTLLEIVYFVSATHPQFRQNLLQKLKDPYYLRSWNDFEAYSKGERANQVEVVKNRGSLFWQVETIKRVVGQPQNTVKWTEAMDEGKIILCNLGQTAHSSEKANKQLAIILVHQIIQAARTRRGEPATLRPFYLYVDEFGEVVCKDFAKGLDTLRQFGVPLILANQRFGQLRQELGEDLYSAVMSNTLWKAAFNIWSEDADAMVEEIFTKQIHGNDIKYQGYHTLLIPHTEIISLAGDSSSTSYSPGTAGHVSTFGDDLTARSSSDSSSWPVGPTHSDTSGSHEAAITKYEREYEDDTPVFFSLEEKRAFYKNVIMSQGVGESKLKFVTRNPITLKTVLPKPIFVTDENLDDFRKRSYSKNGVLTSTEATALIQRRHRELLGDDYAALCLEDGSESPIVLGETLDVSQRSKYEEEAIKRPKRRSKKPYKPRSRPPKA